MARGQLIHVRIAARDPARAARFYAACFGWQVLAEEAAGVRFTAPGGLEGTFWAGGEPSSAGAELYVEVVGIEAVVKLAITLGGLRIARVAAGPGGVLLAQLLDTEGNRVGVWEAPVAGAPGAGA